VQSSVSIKLHFAVQPGTVTQGNRTCYERDWFAHTVGGTASQHALILSRSYSRTELNTKSQAVSLCHLLRVHLQELLALLYFFPVSFPTNFPNCFFRELFPILAPSQRQTNNTNTECPATEPRHFFNNSNINEDIATKFEQQYVRCVRNEEECVCSPLQISLQYPHEEALAHWGPLRQKQTNFLT